MKEKFILASASPRRREILDRAGISFSVIPSDFEETTDAETPEEYVKTLAAGKAEGVAALQKGTVLILGADTVVVHRGRILTKPKDREDAFAMLSALQGDEHEVYTGVSLYRRQEDGTVQKNTFAVCTRVIFYPVSEAEIRDYLQEKEYADKAGAYAIQGKSAVFIKGIWGDYLNVVGLPLSAVVMALKSWGISLHELCVRDQKQAAAGQPENASAE